MSGSGQEYQQDYQDLQQVLQQVERQQEELEVLLVKVFRELPEELEPDILIAQPGGL